MDALSDAIVEDSLVVECGHWVECSEVCRECGKCLYCCPCGRCETCQILYEQRRNIAYQQWVLHFNDLYFLNGVMQLLIDVTLDHELSVVHDG